MRSGPFTFIYTYTGSVYYQVEVGDSRYLFRILNRISKQFLEARGCEKLCGTIGVAEIQARSRSICLTPGGRGPTITVNLLR